MSDFKLPRGRIYAWRRVGNSVWGQFERFRGLEGSTSKIISIGAPCTVKTSRGLTFQRTLSTINSLYTLVGEENLPYPTGGPWILLVERSINGEVKAPADSIVWPCCHHDYGAASDNSIHTGIEHVSVTLNRDGKTPFFTVPRCLLRSAPWETDKYYG